MAQYAMSQDWQANLDTVKQVLKEFLSYHTLIFKPKIIKTKLL